MEEMYDTYAESFQALNSGDQRNVAIPTSFLKYGAANELAISFSAAMAEEIEVKIGSDVWGLFGAGGYIFIEKKDKVRFTTVTLRNTGIPASNTSNDEIKILVRRVP
jgi:hypothetical protein